MKLWIDGTRQPDVDWVWSRTSAGAIAMLRGGCVEKISFAPDQPDLVEPVLDWMIGTDTDVRRTMHKPTAKAKRHRPLLRCKALPPDPQEAPQEEAS